MDCFELSERWCGWSGVDAIFVAARAAIEAGPLDPPICEVVFDRSTTRCRLQLNGYGSNWARRAAYDAPQAVLAGGSQRSAEAVARVIADGRRSG